MKHVKPPSAGEPQEAFAALATALPTGWHHAVLGLAYQVDKAVELMEKLTPTGLDRDRPELVPSMRRLVTVLIDILDDIDTDPNLEPSLAAWSIYTANNGLSVEGQNLADECEISEDSEPSLGSLDRAVNQDRWAEGGSWPGVDYEQDDSDLEPTLGSLDHNHTQEQWAAGGRRDMEEDPAEAGIGDQDGLDEQVPFRDWQMVGMV